MPHFYMSNTTKTNHLKKGKIFFFFSNMQFGDYFVLRTILHNNWDDFCKNDHSIVHASLSIGSSYAMLLAVHSTSCDSPQVLRRIYFENNKDDAMMKLMQIHSLNDNTLTLVLPNLCLGFFEKKHADVDDEYILTHATDTVWHNDTDMGVQYFFELLKKRIAQIRVRRAWEILYCRCFRKSFRPGGTQAQKLLLTYDTVW